MGILYLFYYFCKYNHGVATPQIQETFGFSSAAFGMTTTVFTLVYAAGQFINGYLGDRFGPKIIVIIGGLGGVVANFLFASTAFFSVESAVVLNLMILFWGVNAYFSSMGWSPGCRIMFNWFPENRWGQWIGIYNALCYTGGAIVVPIAGFSIAKWGWQAAFIISPLFLLAMTFAFMVLGKNSPEDAGFETEWETEPLETSPEGPAGTITMRDYARAFFHPKMNLAYISGFGSNFIRWGLMSWMVKILNDPIAEGGFGMGIGKSALLASLLHWGGAFFSIALGVVSDRVFKGVRWQTILMGNLLTAAALVVISKGPGLNIIVLSAALFVSGGMIQAVQTPLFTMPADILGKRMGSTGAGIMDGWMYIGASLAGVGLGGILDVHGLTTGVLVMAAAAFVCGLVIIPTQR